VCGRFNLIDSAKVKCLCDALGIDLLEYQKQRDIAPGHTIAIAHSLSGIRQVSDAIWWLLLETRTLKPNYRYASFNSRSDKLFAEGSISYVPFRQSRCIIPASAFIEGLGDKKIYHKIELENSAIAFGGLCKEHLNQETGEIIYSASIITHSPSTPEWREIHPKSMPFIIDFTNQTLVEQWLDPSFQAVEGFRQFFAVNAERPMRVTRIGKPSKWNPVSESFLINA
jgi:putative SOS response-associated peptidase YedK